MGKSCTGAVMRTTPAAREKLHRTRTRDLEDQTSGSGGRLQLRDFRPGSGAQTSLGVPLLRRTGAVSLHTAPSQFNRGKVDYQGLQHLGPNA
jgi:hypothetical protein